MNGLYEDAEKEVVDTWQNFIETINKETIINKIFCVKKHSTTDNPAHSEVYLFEKRFPVYTVNRRTGSCESIISSESNHIAIPAYEIAIVPKKSYFLFNTDACIDVLLKEQEQKCVLKVIKQVNKNALTSSKFPLQGQIKNITNSLENKINKKIPYLNVVVSSNLMDKKAIDFNNQQTKDTPLRFYTTRYLDNEILIAPPEEDFGYFVITKDWQALPCEGNIVIYQEFGCYIVNDCPSYLITVK